MTNSNDRLMWLNGKILPVTDAKINVLAPTSQFGANVFEGIRCYWNEEDQQLYAFRLHDHYKRLNNSIKLFKMESHFTTIDFEKSLLDVIRANKYKEDIAVRQTVFINGFGTWSSTGPVNMFVSPIPKARKNNNNLERINCCISSWTRISDKNMSPRAKVGANYINSRMGQLEALESGYDTCIFLNELGKISEGPGSCFFMIKDNKIITPSLSSSVLESITRDTIIYLVQHILNMKVEERLIDRSEVYLAEEAFLCGSAMEIGPVTMVDGYKIGKGDIGEITKKIHKTYLELLTGKIKIKNWNTPVYAL